MNLIKSIYKKLKSYQIIIFKLPTKKNFLLYGDIHVSFLRKYFDFTLLNISKEKKVYLFIILKLLIKFKRINFENYSIEFISYINPKCVLTFMDNNLNFYKLKKHSQIKFVAYKTHQEQKNFCNKFKKIKIRLCFNMGDSIQKKYKKY